MRLAGKAASRLAYAKHALRAALLEPSCGSRVGWAIFTEHRSVLLLAPLEVCAHLSEPRSAFERIDARRAWSGTNEVGKGLHSALGVAGQLPDKPSLVFVTDGQQAPPIDSRFQRPLDDVPGAVRGLIVGVGKPTASPIPKTNPERRPLGFWRADEVLQSDPSRPGRSDLDSARAFNESDAAAGPAAGGTEHFSALHEDHLRGLAERVDLQYLRLQDAAAFFAALIAPKLARQRIETFVATRSADTAVACR